MTEGPPHATASAGESLAPPRRDQLKQGFSHEFALRLLCRQNRVAHAAVRLSFASLLIARTEGRVYADRATHPTREDGPARRRTVRIGRCNCSAPRGAASSWGGRYHAHAHDRGRAALRRRSAGGLHRSAGWLRTAAPRGLSLGAAALRDAVWRLRAPTHLPASLQRLAQWRLRALRRGVPQRGPLPATGYALPLRGGSARPGGARCASRPVRREGQQR